MAEPKGAALVPLEVHGKRQKCPKVAPLSPKEGVSEEGYEGRKFARAVSRA
tara:strand:+ start:471 stop:623 length:153 start_codon:yes stop_codon:yes gene_type:complete